VGTGVLGQQHQCRREDQRHEIGDKGRGIRGETRGTASSHSEHKQCQKRLEQKAVLGQHQHGTNAPDCPAQPIGTDPGALPECLVTFTRIDCTIEPTLHHETDQGTGPDKPAPDQKQQWGFNPPKHGNNDDNVDRGHEIADTPLTIERDQLRPRQPVRKFCEIILPRVDLAALR
jgi:hypothetical protein